MASDATGNTTGRAQFSSGGYIEAETDMSPYAVGREWDKLRMGQRSDKYFNLSKPHLDRPCPTITARGRANTAGVAHPTERRKFSIAELRCICSFPPDFKLIGTYPQQWERLGRAVPPLMMKAIAESITSGILQEAKSG